MTLPEVITQCAMNAEFVEHFNRLTGNCLVIDDKDEGPHINKLIDKATGYDPRAELWMRQRGTWLEFTAFVIELVWTRMSLVVMDEEYPQ